MTDSESLEALRKLAYDCAERVLENNMEYLPFYFEDVMPTYDILYKCTTCGDSYKNEIELADHVMIMHDKIFGDIFICPHCNNIFGSGIILDEHIFTHHPDRTNNDNDNDEEQPVEQHNRYAIEINHHVSPTAPVGPAFGAEPRRVHECPICHKKYKTHLGLGEHFTNRHFSYGDQMLLDKKIWTGSFAGFVVLEYIGFIFVPPSMKYDETYKDKKCNICCEPYTLLKNTSKMQITKSADLDAIDDMCDDVEFVVPVETEKRFPIIMTCCRGEICHDCLKKYLQNPSMNGNVQCPYCMSSHEQYNDEYIKFIDFEICNDTWEQWWKSGDRAKLLPH